MQRRKPLLKTPEPVLTLEERIEKRACELSHLYFTRRFFKIRQNADFRVNWHHHYIADTLEKVERGELQNVLFNVSPGSSKTEEVVINWIARNITRNPWCRFLHVSYSDDLALQNSQTARDLIAMDEYQKFWPTPISDDAKAKKRWNVMLDGKRAGGVYAAALGGQITGFRAGHMKDGFQGAILIDDPMKPEDAFSEPALKRANRRLLTTIKSRKANPKTPIVVIMQRISDNDPSAFILSGALGVKFHHVVIPAIIDDAYIAKLDPKYQAMIDKTDFVEADEGAKP